MSTGAGGGRSHLVYHDRKVLLKYHRLLSGTHFHPPNSLAGLRWVLAHGAEVVELDVGLSRDGHFCLNHDATLERETTGRGPLKAITVQEFKALRLRDSDEPTATLTDVVATLLTVRRPVKVQVDLKEAEPISPEIGRALLEGISPLRATAHINIVVGCLGDWNLRLLRRLDPTLALGLDFMLYLDAPVDELARLPMRVNAYGYLDDHPLGFRRLVDTKAYLQDRLEVLIELVPGAVEFYIRKEFLLHAMADGFNPVAFIHERKPGTLVDVWTFYADEPDLKGKLTVALDAGADQISSPTCALLADHFARV